MSRKERQAQAQHPKLYKMGQKGLIKALAGLVWTRKAQKVAKKHSSRRAYTSRSSAPRQTVIYVYGGTVNF